MTLHVSLNYFPAKVLLPLSGTVEPARAYMATDEAAGSPTVLTVFIEGPGEPVIRLQREVISYEGNPNTGLAVQVEDGLVMIGAANGCGCGSVLKGYEPWPEIPKTMVPL